MTKLPNRSRRPAKALTRVDPAFQETSQFDLLGLVLSTSGVKRRHVQEANIGPKKVVSKTSKNSRTGTLPSKLVKLETICGSVVVAAMDAHRPVQLAR
jgi:hypothetical protein